MVLTAASLVVVGALARRPPGTSIDSADRVAAAQRLANRGDWPAALTVMRSAAERAPDDPLVLAWLATSAANAGRPPAEIETPLRRAASLRAGADDQTRGFVDAASAVLIARDPAAAVSAYRAHLERYPRDVWSRRFLAHQLLSLGHTDDATAQLALVARLQPDDFRSQADAAMFTAWLADDPTRTRPFATRALTLLPKERNYHRPADIAFVLMYPATDVWRSGDVAAAHRSAESAWRSALAYSPAVAEAAAPLMADILWTLGRLGAVDGVIDAMTDQARRHYWRGRIALARGDRARARAELLAVPPEAGMAAAIDYAAAGLDEQMEASLEFYSRRAVPPPTAADNDYPRAVSRGDDGGAVEAARRALGGRLFSAPDVRGGGIYLQRRTAEALLRLGRTDEAIRVLEGVRAAMPILWPMGFLGHEWLAARSALCSAYVAAGRIERAREEQAELGRWLAAAEPGFQPACVNPQSQ
jgi:tetratricopeptide (TPR) repeat protein